MDVPLPTFGQITSVLRSAVLGAGAEEQTERPAPFSRSSWLWLALCLALVAFSFSSFDQGPDWWGVEDWDYFAHHYEACRKSVLEYGQFPWWNPWNNGGTPLASNPQVGIFSPHFLCALAFGTYPGLKLTVFLYVAWAAIGTFLLSREILGSRMASALAATIYSLNGAVAEQIAAGHLGVLAFAWLPWLMLWLRRARGSANYGWLIGLGLAAMCHGPLHYVSIYTILIVGVFALLWSHSGGFARNLAAALIIAGFVVVALTGQRLLLCRQLFREFPRPYQSTYPVETSLVRLVASLTAPTDRIDPKEFSDALRWHEFAAYASPVALVFFLASLRHGWRWWHTLAFGAFWLSIGNLRWHHPGSWLDELPGVLSMRLPTRWRVPAMLGLALGAAHGLSLSRGGRADRTATTNSDPSSVDWISCVMIAAALIGCGDLAFQARRALGRAFSAPAAPWPDPPIADGIEQRQQAPAIPACRSGIYAAIRVGRGVISGYDPLVAHYERGWKTWGKPDRHYRGESGPDSVIQESWSPNRIILTGPPGTQVWLNQNPGSYWRAGAERPFEKHRVVERAEDFVLEMPPTGRVELVIDPTIAAPGLWLQVAAAVMCVVIAVATRRLRVDA